MKKKRLYLAGVLMLMLILVAATCMGCGKSETFPVVSLDGECLNDYTNWNDKSTYYPATLTFDNGKKSFTMDIEIKPQGTSSMAYPKKNFTVKFAEGVEFVDKWGEQTKYVLKADYIDPTRSGNVVSAKLAAQMSQEYGLFEDTPNYGAIDGFPIWVKINGEDAGIFNLTIPKDAWMFGMDEDDPNHLVLACEGFSPACRMESAEIDYEVDWTFEVGEENDASKAAFERMVEFVSTADDETFVRDFDQYLDLDACLNYICFINTAYAGDNITKNLLMATYDGKIWYPVLYDLDSLWGIDPYGTGIIATEEANVNWAYRLLSDDNYLFNRVSNLFRDQLTERYWELREGILSKENIMEGFETYTAQIPQEYYEIDHSLWNADGKLIRTVDLMSQLMDEYLPHIDGHFQGDAASDVVEPTAVQDSDNTSVGNQAAALTDPLIHYVWETDGVQYSLEDIEALPVATTFSYTLDGAAISVEELAGKSGKVEATLRVERKADTDDIYGVAAVVQVEQAQCKNLTVTGGTHTASAEKNADVCMGSAWLGQTDNVYEMKLSMDVTDFDPAKYVVTINPVYVAGGGDDDSLQALLSTAGELTAIIDDGITLHTSLVEWHTYLTNVQNSLAGAGALAGTLVPDTQDSAVSVMESLLTGAEAEADALLKSFGYQVAANMTSEKRAELLSQASADSKRTQAEKDQASGLLERIENYLVVATHLQTTQQTAAELNSALTNITTTLPDLVDAYSYANDTLYGILYRISTLYQNIANYYASVGGDGSAWVESGDWCDVIIFTNHDNIIPEQSSK